MSYYGWGPYVTVAERRAMARKQIEKMKKRGIEVRPVQPNGRKIAGSFWGKGWCDHMESFSDYANRLPRGRTYVRNGSVCHLEIRSGRIKAIVSGSELYNIQITISPLSKSKWAAVKRACSGKIGSLIDLLRGKLDKGVMEVVSDRKDGLFPRPGEMKFECDCPDWADMCKHVAAVLYGVGARLDDSPEMLFALRGVNHEELVDVSTAVAEVGKGSISRRRIAATGIADVFGIELAEADNGVNEKQLPAVSPRKSMSGKTRKKTASSAKMPTNSSKRTAAKMSQKRKSKEPSQNFPFPVPLTGEAIYFWRSSLGETQAKFASRLGMSAGSISQWEKKGKRTLGIQNNTLKALQKAWNLTRGGK